jgi:hypothetical protein
MPGMHPNVATVNGNGLLTTINEGTVTLTAKVDGVSTSKTITVSDRPNLYLYQSSSIVMNGLYKALGFSMYNFGISRDRDGPKGRCVCVQWLLINVLNVEKKKRMKIFVLVDLHMLKEITATVAINIIHIQNLKRE